MRVRHRLALALSSFLAACAATPTATAPLDPQAAQAALVHYMHAHPDCFAGYTPHLIQSAQQIIVSDDGTQVFVGSIRVDRVQRTYRFERFVEDSSSDATTHLFWSGRFETAAGRSLRITAPTLNEEHLSK